MLPGRADSDSDSGGAPFFFGRAFLPIAGDWSPGVCGIDGKDQISYEKSTSTVRECPGTVTPRSQTYRSRSRKVACFRHNENARSSRGGLSVQAVDSLQLIKFTRAWTQQPLVSPLCPSYGTSKALTKIGKRSCTAPINSAHLSHRARTRTRLC